MGDCYIARTATDQHPWCAALCRVSLCVSPADRGIVWRALEFVVGYVIYIVMCQSDITTDVTYARGM
jgi:hypothetical protein